MEILSISGRWSEKKERESPDYTTNPNFLQKASVVREVMRFSLRGKDRWIDKWKGKRVIGGRKRGERKRERE
eukprot:296491-Amorphochlora_amoeboformis.AAC.1